MTHLVINQSVEERNYTLFSHLWIGQADDSIEAATKNMLFFHQPEHIVRYVECFTQAEEPTVADRYLIFRERSGKTAASEGNFDAAVVLNSLKSR